MAIISKDEDGWHVEDPIGVVIFIMMLWVLFNWLASAVNSPWVAAPGNCTGNINGVNSQITWNCTPASVAGIFSKIVNNPYAQPLMKILIPIAVGVMLYGAATMFLDVYYGDAAPTPRSYLSARGIGEIQNIERGLVTKVERRSRLEAIRQQNVLTASDKRELRAKQSKEIAKRMENTERQGRAALLQELHIKRLQAVNAAEQKTKLQGGRVAGRKRMERLQKAQLPTRVRLKQTIHKQKERDEAIEKERKERGAQSEIEQEAAIAHEETYE